MTNAEIAIYNYLYDWEDEMEDCLTDEVFRLIWEKVASPMAGVDLDSELRNVVGL